MTIGIRDSTVLKVYFIEATIRKSGDTMNLKHIENLNQIMPEINNRYFRQVFVNEDREGHTVRFYSKQQNIPYINLNMEFSRILKEVPKKRRIYKITDIFATIIQSHVENTICLDYYELLFDPSLSVNAFDLFKSASRNKTLIIAWRGKLTEQEFIYAEPGHPEYTKYPIHDTIVIN